MKYTVRLDSVEAEVVHMNGREYMLADVGTVCPIGIPSELFEVLFEETEEAAATMRERLNGSNNVSETPRIKIGAERSDYVPNVMAESPAPREGSVWRGGAKRGGTMERIRQALREHGALTVKELGKLLGISTEKYANPVRNAVNNLQSTNELNRELTTEGAWKFSLKEKAGEAINV